MVPHAEMEAYLIRARERLDGCDGNAFQNFVADLMFQKHGDDFQTPGNYGNLGDLGCDGYLTSENHAFQCYSPEKLSEAKAKAKLKNDLDRAKNKWPAMKKWCYVLNAEDAPAPVVNAAVGLQQPGLVLTTWSRKNLYQVIRTLNRNQLHALLGPIQQFSTMDRLTREAISNIIERLALPEEALDNISLPPASKMDSNDIGKRWRENLRIGMAGSPVVKQFFETLGNRDLGGRVASAVRAEYEALRDAGGDADHILNKMAEFFQQASASSAEEYLAVFGLISYFFETCHILEPAPKVIA